MKINLIEFFVKTVAEYSQKVAVIEGEKSITFGELDISVRKLAGFIQEICSCQNMPIALYLPKSIDAVVGDIAITYSGNAYMNLDVNNPAERILNIINLIQPKAIVTNTTNYKNISKIVSDTVEIINIDEIELNNVPSQEFLLEKLSNIIDCDPYCIINTSGSTGTPKGVVLNHRSFIDFMAQTFGEYNFNSNDVIGTLSPIVFDIWSYELCLLMGVGASIVVIPESNSAFPVKILQLMNQTKVSYIFWVPTIMVNIANMGLLSQINLPSLRVCWFAGEVFPTKQFNIWRKSLPHVQFCNYYGPIEITLDCVYYNIERDIPDNEPIPIGKAFRNTDIIILDEDNKRISEKNIAGELCVRGTSLAMGYYNDSEKTSFAFVQNPLNRSYPEIIYRTGDVVYINDLGEIVFKGRKDSLIKHLGYRIELGEIEHIIINTLKLVKNGCVVYNHQRKEITLYFESETELSAGDFRKAIGNSLPKYMIPLVYKHIKELKRNPNGKIDRLYYSKLVEE